MIRATAEHISRSAANVIRERGRFTFVLSGGSTPKPLYALLATEEYRNRIDWSRVHFFWGDDRCVPPSDEASNYRLVSEALLAHVPARPEHIHRMQTELSPEECARDYERRLQGFFQVGSGEAPVFDFDLLGLGTNAHTASLFPFSPALKIDSALATAVEVDDKHRWRVTLTLPVINRARETVFLVAGSEKSDVVNEVIFGERNPEKLPAQLVQPSGNLIWRIDHAAASKLPQGSFTTE